MTLKGDEEFWFNFIMFGGIIFVLLIVAIWLLAVRWKTNKDIKKSSIIKELYNEKERKNGQNKGGSRGHY
jgi:hypothetical protein